ncbi:hypothetical protein [Streptomyces sp. SA15]|uniref:hypothetical protein n=1 Tax=Streptomyces sp. SA15 TaxID=934019 RepID=UPI00211C99E9|nr:hypothetical protein [Streptomyces sp. SA15]
MAEQRVEERAEQRAEQRIPRPLRAATSVLSKVPGAGLVGRAAEGTLDRIGAVSPRGRRIAVYTGAGVLGVAGVVEWPVAITGAAVAWLTQPRGKNAEEQSGEATGDTAWSGGSGGASGGAEGESPTPRVMPSHLPSSVRSSAGTSGRSSAEEAKDVQEAEETRDTASPPVTPSDKLPTHAHTNG